MAGNETVIEVEHVWKQYGLRAPEMINRAMRAIKKQTSIERESALMTGVARNTAWALKDISFSVSNGEALGIIGRNGSGKSTLLKVLSGVSPVTHGKVKVVGTIFPMIELNAGMHTELTGRENIRLLGTIMGFTRKEMDKKIPIIEEFTELGEWLNNPVRMYSSGMQARLGFGVAMNADADVMLIDEVLATGDLAFQYKCLSKMEELYSAGKAIVLVSHSMSQVSRICNKVIILDQGSIYYEGSTENAIKKYEVFSQEKQRESRQLIINGNTKIGKVIRDVGIVTLLYAEVITSTSSNEICSGEPFEVLFEIEVNEQIQNINVNFKVQGVRSEPVTWHTIHHESLQPGTFHGKVTLEQTWFVPGRWYDLLIGIEAGAIKKSILNVVIGSIFVNGESSSSLGYFHPPATWEWNRKE